MSVTVDQKLQRLLHYGSERPIYEAGSWKGHKSASIFQSGELTSIEGILAEERAQDIISHVMEAHKNGYVAYPEISLFVLAFCAKKDSNLELRKSAYEAVEKIYGPPNLFFSFVKFASDISKPTAGWGRALRRTVNNWYLSKEPRKLAESVTKHIGMNGWSHKDIFKLAHIHSDDPAKNVIFNYVVSGMKKTEKVYGHKSEVNDVMNYLQEVDTIKHSTEATAVSLLISKNSFSFEYVPSSMYRSRDIWMSLIPTMPISTLLKTLKRLSRYRLLRRKSPLVAIIVQRLNDVEALKEEQITPAEIFLYSKKYEASARLRFIDRTRPVKPPPPVNPVISDALGTLLNSAVGLLKPNGLKFLIALNNGYDMQMTKCFQCREMTCSWASLLIAHCILRKENDASLAVFSGTDMEEVHMDKTVTFNEMIAIMKGRCSAAKINMALPMLWAEKHKKAVDVFIVVSNNNSEPGTVTVPAALQQYRTAMNQPKAKYIGIGLESSGVTCVNQSDPDPGMLEIRGFDTKISLIIEAFSQGLC